MTGPKPRRRVVLIGFMGAGKTTVGRSLAERLGWVFYDLDEVIEAREQRRVARIFDESGEHAFREIERNALTELLGRSEEGCVIALGGGAFTCDGNRQMLEKACATTVLLTASVEELLRRCEEAGPARPLARDKNRFQQLFAGRQQAYNTAQFRVDTEGKGIPDVVGEIEQILKVGNRGPDGSTLSFQSQKK